MQHRRKKQWQQQHQPTSPPLLLPLNAAVASSQLSTHAAPAVHGASKPATTCRFPSSKGNRWRRESRGALLPQLPTHVLPTADITNLTEEVLSGDLSFCQHLVKRLDEFLKGTLLGHAVQYLPC